MSAGNRCSELRIGTGCLLAGMFTKSEVWQTARLADPASLRGSPSSLKRYLPFINIGTAARRTRQSRWPAPAFRSDRDTAVHGLARGVRRARRDRAHRGGAAGRPAGQAGTYRPGRARVARRHGRGRGRLPGGGAHGHPPLAGLHVPLFFSSPASAACGRTRPRWRLPATGRSPAPRQPGPALPFLLGAILSPLAGLGGQGAACVAGIMLTALCALALASPRIAKS
jgi:hypothetical protein